jgi:hypothetical protein
MPDGAFTIEDLTRKIVETLRLTPGKDVVEIAVDRLDENRLMIIRHAPTDAVRE